MAMNVKIILTGRGLSMLRSLLRGLYVSAAAAIALSLQGCDIVTTCPPENLPRYVATLTIVNESSHTVVVSDWVWTETGSFAVPGTLRLGPGESSEEFFGRTIDGNLRGVSLESVAVVYDGVLEIVYGELPKEEYGHSMVAPECYGFSESELLSGDFEWDFTFTFTDEDYETAVLLTRE